MEQILNSSYGNNNKKRLIMSINTLTEYIDNLMANREWNKICEYKIDSDKYKKCKSVTNNYSTYSILFHNFYRMSGNRQGFILVKVSGDDGGSLYTNKPDDKDFKIELEVVLYYTQDKYIDRQSREPEFWKYKGGYSMNVVREIYAPNIDIDFNLKNIDNIGFLDLVKYFEEIKNYIPTGMIKYMILHTLIPNKFRWPNLEKQYWALVGPKINTIVVDGSGLFSSLNDDITLKNFVRTNKGSIRPYI